MKVDANNKTFQQTVKKLDPGIRKQLKAALGELLLMDPDNVPAKLHLHPLKNREVLSVLDPKRFIPSTLQVMTLTRPVSPLRKELLICAFVEATMM